MEKIIFRKMRFDSHTMRLNIRKLKKLGILKFYEFLEVLLYWLKDDFDLTFGDFSLRDEKNHFTQDEI